MKNKLTFVLAFMIMSVSAAVFAQETEGTGTDDPVKNADGSYSTNQYNEAERPDDSYLAKFHAQEVVTDLMKKNLDQLLLMKVVSSNFDKGWSEDLDKCYSGYKKAMAYYYKRNMIYAGREFENNQQDIQALLKKMADEYQKETKTLLDECIPQILEVYLSEKTKGDIGKSRKLEQNQNRLRVAFGQYDDGCFANTTKNCETAIYHFRVAKGYAIKIMEDFAKPEDAESLKTKYQVHKADNLNRIFNKQSSETDKE